MNGKIEIRRCLSLNGSIIHQAASRLWKTLRTNLKNFEPVQIVEDLYHTKSYMALLKIIHGYKGQGSHVGHRGQSTQSGQNFHQPLWKRATKIRSSFLTMALHRSVIRVSTSPGKKSGIWATPDHVSAACPRGPPYKDLVPESKDKIKVIHSCYRQFF